MKLNYLFILLAVVCLISCSTNQDELIIRGSIDDSKGEMIYLEKMVDQRIVMLDSSALSSSGKFKFRVDRPKYPEFYFLKMKNSASITLLSDSTQLIVVKSSASSFVESATIAGNRYSSDILSANKRLSDFRRFFVESQKAYQLSENENTKKMIADSVSMELTRLKKQLSEEIIANAASFYSYYILYQKINENYAFFDPLEKKDSKLFAAVANVLSIHYPEAPRTVALLSRVKGIMAAQRSEEWQNIISNTPETLPDFEMEDINGKKHRLSELKGKLVVLNYWMSSSADSRQWNTVLKSIYGKYHPSGFEIYQFSLDKSKLLWEDAMNKDELPWISVCDFQGSQSEAVWKYNVTELPSTFLISREGKIIGRFKSELDLRNAIKKHL